VLAGVSTALSGFGCATLSQQEPSLVPTQYRTETGPYAVFSNFAIAADATPIRSLHSLEHDVEQSLGVRVDADQPPIEVYILNDRQAFTHFLKFYYPELPPRRAFFLAQGLQRVVFTFQGERLEEDLRHEATHALLNVAYGDLPLWLDEGLAEYFEGAGGRRGMNPEHLGRLPRDLATGWKPDLARLETLQSVRQMAPRDYREAWAWTHYLLNGSPQGKSVLLGYLADRRNDPHAAPISARLQKDERGTSERLMTYIGQVRATALAAAPTSDDPTVRLQDNAIDSQRSSSSSAPKKSVFSRIRAFFGL
jgi:hypothetical protein